MTLSIDNLFSNIFIILVHHGNLLQPIYFKSRQALRAIPSPLYSSFSIQKKRNFLSYFFVIEIEPKREETFCKLLSLSLAKKRVKKKHEFRIL